MSKNNEAPPNIKLLKQRANGRLAIGISGPNEDITRFANQIYNYEGTNSLLNYLSEDFIYIFVEEKQFKRCLNTLFGTKTSNQMMKEIIPENFFAS